jgi:hypothetical protein
VRDGGQQAEQLRFDVGPERDLGGVDGGVGLASPRFELLGGVDLQRRVDADVARVRVEPGLCRSAARSGAGWPIGGLIASSGSGGRYWYISCPIWNSLPARVLVLGDHQRVAVGVLGGVLEQLPLRVGREPDLAGLEDDRPRGSPPAACCFQLLRRPGACSG